VSISFLIKFAIDSLITEEIKLGEISESQSERECDMNKVTENRVEKGNKIFFWPDLLNKLQKKESLRKNMGDWHA
jgi:hypothetical protein